MLRKNILSRYRKPFAILMLFMMFLSTLPPIVNAEAITPEVTASANGYPTNLVIITGTTSLVSPLVEAYHNLTKKRNPSYQFGLSIFSDADLASNTAKVQQAVQNADVVLVQMISDTRTDTFHTILSNSWEAQWKNGKAPAIYTQGCSDGFPINIVNDLPIQANINNDDLTAITKYISASGTDNCERLLLFLASKYGASCTILT